MNINDKSDEEKSTVPPATTFGRHSPDTEITWWEGTINMVGLIEAAGKAAEKGEGK